MHAGHLEEHPRVRRTATVTSVVAGVKKKMSTRGRSGGYAGGTSLTHKTTGREHQRQHHAAGSAPGQASWRIVTTDEYYSLHVSRTDDNACATMTLKTVSEETVPGPDRAADGRHL